MVSAAFLRAVGEEETFEAVVWRVPEPVESADLEKLHRLLLARGRLLAIVRPEIVRPLCVALAESGFSIVEENAVSLAVFTLTVVVARREDFKVRGYQEGDEAAILRLFGPSFHVTRSLEHWRWKFLANPWGQRKISIALSPDQELAAHYSGYPIPFRSHERKARRFIALQIGDTMTDPRFRGVGRGPTSLLGRCVQHFYKAHCEEHVAFNYGFNTGNHQKFSLLFVGARRIEAVGYWIRPATSPPRSGYRVSTVESLDHSFDRLLERVVKAYGLLVERDSTYLNWRYLACPDQPRFVVLAAYRFFRLVGWSVFRRRDDKLLWVDALFDPRHAAAASDLLRSALELPEYQGVTSVEGWFSPRPAFWRRTLSDLGFKARPEPNDLALMCVPHLEREADRHLLDLYYTMGDSDLA